MNRIIKEDETLDDLQLKGIHVIQKKQAFRFGIDAVLLANFPTIKNGAKVVDLCSGTGIISFILAGKTNASNIIGIEIQKEIADMAKRSIKYNNLQEKVRFIEGDLKNLKLLKDIEKVDVVTVNPPYKTQGTGIININDKNAISRHEICCTLDDVVKAAKVLLKDKGKLYMIHRPDRIVDIMNVMRKYYIEPKLIRIIHPAVDKPPSMILIEGQKNGGKFLKWDRPLYIYDENNKYTNEVKRIYGME
ncbi:TPA: tRNA1(Val) (adenine(37)-N6)-methyltransferase [Clostridium botulinum]|uniref:tRNA1(Val) (adenine(37)-N6)-methyltransferase n=1 Tax=Clostridium botulinum TaxID=1491 RepID=UPI00099BA239|nr:tRNA1(Val) (adenine(37)-N6)-methyltransferase [Clostridium botulinum]NFA98387.1 tRNA1(Val) (adenine(37)-N6)-methyltransferase [Clostridium botulinum]NFB51902.1 tRNA1(Val) (adenine(37)-N6)-methyltransferase [Clostridium botulinum]NFC76174.1 tRNA1(Val) (adenine(37)-N6)-methyltransferase [Clostridium botulinum]NFC89104.1 tRNA1(Val) (adenine(37)-N6)-methyltransferase [Clostridium botulinum]NFD05772.1 tRNA1(Val) (adenine(37)-N6)-methyltransferase [Clostridium botulinum]